MVYLLLGLCLLGVTDAVYLSYIHITRPHACITSGCEGILTSSYAYIAGVPFVVIGVGIYTALLVLALLLRYSQSLQHQRRALWWIHSLALLGSGVSGYLVYLQGFVIEYWCPFCLLSAAVMGAITAITFVMRQRDKDALPFFRFPYKDIREAGCTLMTVFLVVGAYWGLKPLMSNGHVQWMEPPGQTIIAKIGERTIRMEALERGMGTQLVKLRQDIYEAQLQWLEGQLLEIEAKHQGLEVDQLVERLIKEKGIQVSDAEVQAYYEAHKAHITEEPWQVLLPKIRRYLMQEAVTVALQSYIHTLKRKYDFASFLPQPRRFIIPQNPHGAAELGPANAPLTVIEFSDFECPYCSKAHRHIKELIQSYPGQIRLIFRHNPLAIHIGAKIKSIAAVCSQAQGRFWEYADRLFLDQEPASEEVLIDYAISLGMDAESFKDCLSSRTAADHVATDAAQAEHLGVQSAPVFFFNGEISIGYPEPRPLMRILKEAGL